MRILISNDDGYRAEGIVALHEALNGLAEVEVVAPEHNNSAKSNALTLNAPLYVHSAGPAVRYVNGTPADCVHIALTGLLGYRPDLVVSGINNGPNMGDDTLYSGTVGAAMEGYLFGVPAIAFSLAEKGWTHLDAATRAARRLVEQVLHDLAARQDAPKPWLLNVNLPARADAEHRPFKICRLGRRHSAEPVIQQINPRGETMYWIGNAGPSRDHGEGTDFHAIEQGQIAITPLRVDLTEHDTLPYWGQSLARLNTRELT